MPASGRDLTRSKAAILDEDLGASSLHEVIMVQSDTCVSLKEGRDSPR